jgi:hypothetical protein
VKFISQKKFQKNMDPYEKQNSTGQSGSLLLNRSLRAVRYPGFVGGRILGGYSSSSLQGGVGDCVLFDFADGLFAVSDGSDRNPADSRHFMVMFSRMLKQSVHAPAGTIHSAADISDIRECLAAESEKLLCSMPFRTGCTFTGVLLLRTVDGMNAVVMHTGDSLIITCDISDSSACQLTVDNFWLVGRAQRFFQVETLPVSDSTRFVLATDGVSGIPLPGRAGREEFLLRLFKNWGPEEIPDRILGNAGPPSPGRDDASLIAINPSALVYLPQLLILGGTGIYEEKLFQEERGRGLLIDQYIPVPSSDEILTI